MFDKQTREISYLSQFMLSNCFYCKLRNLSFLDYGLFCKNLYGKSYLSDIVVDISEYHYTGIILHYGERSQFDYNRYTEVALNCFGLQFQFIMSTSSLCILAVEKKNNSITLFIIHCTCVYM